MVQHPIARAGNSTRWRRERLRGRSASGAREAGESKTGRARGCRLVPHLADVMAGRYAGRTNAKEISFFNNHGSQGFNLPRWKKSL